MQKLTILFIVAIILATTLGGGSKKNERKRRKEFEKEMRRQQKAQQVYYGQAQSQGYVQPQVYAQPQVYVQPQGYVQQQGFPAPMPLIPQAPLMQPIAQGTQPYGYGGVNGYNNAGVPQYATPYQQNYHGHGGKAGKMLSALNNFLPRI